MRHELAKHPKVYHNRRTAQYLTQAQEIERAVGMLMSEYGMSREDAKQEVFAGIAEKRVRMSNEEVYDKWSRMS